MWIEGVDEPKRTLVEVLLTINKETVQTDRRSGPVNSLGRTRKEIEGRED